MTAVSVGIPQTKFERPNASEAAGLLRIVKSEYRGKDWFDGVGEAEFARALIGVGVGMWRLREPTAKVYFVSHVDAANDILALLGMAEVSGDAVLAAIIATAEIPWRRADRSLGQLLEVALNRDAGLPYENKWRDLLTGTANLLTPLPARPLMAPPSPATFTTIDDWSGKSIGSIATGAKSDDGIAAGLLLSPSARGWQGGGAPLADLGLRAPWRCRRAHSHQNRGSRTEAHDGARGNTPAGACGPRPVTARIGLPAPRAALPNVGVKARPRGRNLFNRGSTVAMRKQV